MASILYRSHSTRCISRAAGFNGCITSTRRAFVDPRLTSRSGSLPSFVRSISSQVSNDHISKLDPILLRDACRCSQCIDPSTQQREFVFSDIPIDIQVSSAQSTSSSGYEVRWTNDISGLNDHVSQYSNTDLQSIASRTLPQTKGRTEVELWDRDIFSNKVSQSVDYQDLLGNTTSLSNALNQFRAYGLIFVNNIPEDSEAVRHIVNRLALLKNTFYGETWDVRSVPQAKNVAYTSKILGFHMDLLYMKEPPGVQLLHCIHNSCTGGESEFADTFKAVEVLRYEQPEYVNLLCKSTIRYGYDNDNHFYTDEKPVIKLSQPADARDANFMKYVERVYWSPPFIDTIATSTTTANISGFVKASKAFADILQRPEMIFETKMESGTCAVFDNLRVVHARKAFDMNSGKRWLKGVYGDYQDIFSKTVKHVDRRGCKTQ
ncbi:hypothetical protein BT93_L5596 [Corymbia citriodora subsp. variegata]|uniref:Gamma-butyrobetaine dioxygenase n=1 Tax=Corymbia citriodora subsp. variegata TaxID=360336 RepID=A0A8T0CGZ5_CORYI|nr:hypothetical protein BT93_L5596 [Corymbia citriodora subsp. variegata]